MRRVGLDTRGHLAARVLDRRLEQAQRVGARMGRVSALTTYVVVAEATSPAAAPPTPSATASR